VDETKGSRRIFAFPLAGEGFSAALPFFRDAMKTFNRLALHSVVWVTILTVFAVVSLYGDEPGDEKLPSQTDLSLKKEVDGVLDKAIAYLFSKQRPETGAWQDNPAITALVVNALLRAPKTLTDDQKAQVDKAVKYILTFVKPDGAIADKTYNDIIKKARDYTIKSQTSETQGFRSDYDGYGGIGYGDRPEQKDRPDLSNTGFALELLALTQSFETEAEKSPEVKKLHFKRALVFLQRCQALPVKDGVGNDMSDKIRETADDEGGGIYAPDDTRGHREKIRNDKGEEVEVFIPYGSMTYTLLKSYIFCELPKEDRRVQAAFGWISRHFTVDENPGMGPEGQYYYYMMMSKALSVYGADWVTQSDGKRVDWRYELMKKLVNLQKIDDKGDGYWLNDKGRWMESDPVLVTAYGLMTLDIAMARRYP
jgi:squalene-hopene/tetraprenyl-beta-curcumene cyclase